MQISVSGKGVDIGESFRDHATKQVDEHVHKFFDRVTTIQSVVSREGHRFRVDLTGNLGTHSGLVVRGRGESEDVYAAFDSALEKVSKQLRRYKRKITNHHQSDQSLRDVDDSFGGKKYTFKPEIGELEDENATSSLVIAEKAMRIESLTVSQAVMKMDLQDLPALMFYNRSHGRLNVVYRRADGNIAWVDPEQQVKAA